jgi:transcriptional regulator with XRE-family HTH domain
MSVVVMDSMVPVRWPEHERTLLPGTRRATLAVATCAIICGMDAADELAACLRSWRDRLSPGVAGLPEGSQRRAPGLRREEVAHLAGLSVDYLSRLEQGRASNPSPSVLAPLARALRLTDDERAHLFRVAGHADPAAGTMRRHLTPSIQRVLDRLTDVPVVVLDASWQLVAANALATALIGDSSAATPRERNLVWRHFTGGPSRFVRTPEEEAGFEAEAVADLHEALGRHPADGRLRALVDDLLEASPRFAAAWEARPVVARVASRKTIAHPEVGRLTLDCDLLTVRDSDLRIIVYSAAPDSPDAQALALLATVGLQSFSSP